MKKPIYFWNEMYFANIYFCPGWSNEDVTAFIKSQFGFDYTKRLSGDGRCLEIEDNDGHWGLIIHLAHNDLTMRTTGALAHEALHATNNILRRIGLRVEIGENDEAQTYLLQWIFMKCYGRLKGAKAHGRS